ncbi:ABC transporter ATP-binding protein [Actinomycetaceae bacterium TAE3-ERU4]|nr:ABC transporter ATP-binding protein [Actinomycetaceae bacterium TAE3-ERU4]
MNTSSFPLPSRLELRQNERSLKDCAQFLDSPESVSTRNEEPIIKLRGVYKDFQQGKETIHALASTDFTAYRGEFIALLGPSGSGKSTLLTIMGGLQQPTGGSVNVGGRDFTSLGSRQLAAARLNEIGFILQSSNLVPFLTVNEQLDLYDRVAKLRHQPGHTQADRDELFTSLGILDAKNQYGSELSGGQLQRAAIARALYAQPSMILADEPTASLDSKKAFAVADLLREQAKSCNTCIIMVTHDERLVDHVDSIYRMEDGHLQREK